MGDQYLKALEDVEAERDKYKELAVERGKERDELYGKLRDARTTLRDIVVMSRNFSSIHARTFRLVADTAQIALGCEDE